MVRIGLNEDERDLNCWMKRQRRYRRAFDAAPVGSEPSKLITPQRIAKLDSIGFIWEPQMKWEVWFELMMKYREKNNLSVNVRRDAVFDGKRLGCWVADQRRRYKSGEMKDVRKARLEAVGFVQDV